MDTKPLTNSIPGATLVLRRLQESLWYGGGIRGFITISRSGNVDYPLRTSDGRVLYDRPEALTKAFRAMVRNHMNAQPVGAR